MTCIVDLQQRWEQLKEIDDGENSSCLVEVRSFVFVFC